MHANTRARWLLDEARKMGGEITMEAMEDLASHIYSGQMTYVEREELVVTALGLYVEERRGESPPPTAQKDPAPTAQKTPKENDMAGTKMSTEDLRRHAADFLQENPTATAAEAWTYVSGQGTPSLKASSFKSMVVPQVRKELGVSGRPLRKGTPGKPVPTKKPAVAPKVTPAPARTATEGADAGRAVVLPPAEDEPSDDRDRIVLETPGGRLTARDEGRDTWFVEFEGAVTTDLLHSLVADLVGPFTPGARP